MSAPQPSKLAGPIQTVFLDRDGVLNQKLPEGRYVTSPAEFHILPGVPRAIARLNQAGLRVIVVSNQRGIALGYSTIDDIRDIHEFLQREISHASAHIDAFYFCPHDKQQCDCRKPLPGLFHQAQADFPSICAATSIILGDSLSDIEFGRRLGMRTVFIDGDPLHQKPGAEQARQAADSCFPSLAAAVEALLAAQPS